jgi:hypothetical protein
MLDYINIACDISKPLYTRAGTVKQAVKNLLGE